MKPKGDNFIWAEKKERKRERKKERKKGKEKKNLKNNSYGWYHFLNFYIKSVLVFINMSIYGKKIHEKM